MGEFNSDDHEIYYCGQESLRRNGVAIIVNKRVQNAVLGCNLKNDRMISVHFQGKPFSIRIIQVYAPTHGVAKSWTRLSNFTFTFHFHALEKEMATHSGVLALRIPGTGKPGGLPSVGLHRVRHD